MTPAQAKRLAESRGYLFYWDAQLRLWVSRVEGSDIEADYHTRATLANAEPERFARVYLAPQTVTL
jgi:hypothetical protein